MIRKFLRSPILLRHAPRFCCTTQLKEEEETPIHLRPYDPSKYEVPSQQIKYSTGYAFLDVDPFPRASIMKLCHLILDRLATEIPAEAMYRIYTEEQLKYIMNLTDQITDIRKLEEELGFDCIEIFIQNLNDELSLVDDMKRIQPWKEDTQQDEIFDMAPLKREELKHRLHQKQERQKVRFLG